MVTSHPSNAFVIITKALLAWLVTITQPLRSITQLVTHYKHLARYEARYEACNAAVLSRPLVEQPGTCTLERRDSYGKIVAYSHGVALFQCVFCRWSCAQRITARAGCS